VLAKLDKGDHAPGAINPRSSQHSCGNRREESRIWADTTTAHGRLMLTVLGGLAEFERELIRARTGEGRERAKERGVKMGRKSKLTPHQQREAVKRRDVEGSQELAPLWLPFVSQR
jgi:Resolvase, N terminal domain